jgi:tetratricopeptide (TPR) repeat protein
MSESLIIKPAGVPLWVVVLSTILLFAGDTRAAEIHYVFRFIDPSVQRLDQRSMRPETQIVVRKAWSEPEKQRVVTALKKVHQIIPGLIERATAFGKVRLFRSSFAKGEGPLASANSFTNSITFTDRFFGIKEGWGILTVAHELTHLADPALVKELSAEWDRLVRPSCKRIQAKLSKDGMRLSYRTDWNQIEKTYGDYARKQGMPSIYACLNWTESLAEHVEAMFVGYRPPEQIRSFINRAYAKSPYKPGPDIISYQKAKSLHLKGKLADAIAAYSRVLTDHPELKTVYYARGKARQRKQEFDAALADFDKAIEVFQRNERKRLVAGIYSSQARIHIEKRNYKAAVAAYGRALEFNPGWIEYRFERGKLLLEKTKEPRQAISDFSEILKYRPNSVPIYLARAKGWEQLEDFPRMDADLTKAINLRPDYAQSYYQRAFAYKDRGQCKKAIADFAQVIRLREANLLDRAFINSARCREAINDYHGAIADYTGLLQSVKRWARRPVPDINAARGLAYFKVGQLKEAYDDLQLVQRLNGKYAVATFTKMIEWQPDNPEGYIFRGQAYIAAGNHDRAIADFSKAIQIQPNQAKAYIQRGQAFSAKRDSVRAIADFSKAIEFQPKDVTTYTLRGKAYAAQKDHDRAIADFTRVIEVQPKDVTAYVLRGKSHTAEMDHDAAIADLTKVIGMVRTPIQKITPYIQRAKAHAAKKDYDRALADLDWVIEKFRKAWVAYAERARTHELQGNTSAAIRDLKEALRLNPKNEQLDEHLKALTSNTKPR